MHYGVGAFEGIRAYHHEDGRSAVFRLAEHTQRLIDSAHLLELKVPYTREQIDQACMQTLAANGMEAGYLRPLVYLGDKEVGVYPGNDPDVRLSVIAWRWGAYLGPEALEKGIRVKISTWTKHHVNALLVKGKICGHYVNSVLAKVEAKREGFDEGILLDHCGYVAGFRREPVHREEWRDFYPGSFLVDSCGITRDTVITLAKAEGIKVNEVRMGRSDLYLADEVFFRGRRQKSPRFMKSTGVRSVPARHGPITRMLQQREYMKLVVAGGVQGYDKWFSFYTPKRSDLNAWNPLHRATPDRWPSGHHIAGLRSFAKFRFSPARTRGTRGCS